MFCISMLDFYDISIKILHYWRMLVSKITNSYIGKKLLVILLLVAFVFTLLFARLAYLQIFMSSDISAKGVSQWTRDLPMMASRGDIVDSNGIVIADSKSVYTLYVRPNALEDVSNTAKIISTALNLDYKYILKKIDKKGVSEITVRKKLNKNEMLSIARENIAGVYFGEESVRQYPYGNFMSQIIGFTNFDGDGQFGVEKSYNKYLSGIDGQILTETDIIGKELDSNVTKYLPSIDGMTVKLTVDYNIQSFAEKAVIDATRDFKAKGANCMVMNPTTGEIYAMAQTPSFDLNDVPRDDLDALFNMSKNQMVSNVYEPGSTFKILTAAIALEEQIFDENHRFFCNGSRIVDGQHIKCWRSIGHGSQTFAEGVNNSCNCVFMDIATAVGVPKMYEYLKAFGINTKTGVDLIGETSGLMLKQSTVKNVDIARIGFGQAVAVTPIGLLTAVSSCLNGGNLVTPYILDSITDKKFGPVLKNSPTIKENVISEETSKKLRELIYGVVEQGGGKHAYVPGYRIGGKTGTAQKYENGAIARGKYISSFLGYTKVGSDEYIMLMTVDEPQGYLYYGSLVAAPYAGELFANIFAYKGYTPTYTDEELVTIGKEISMPNLIDMPADEAIKTLKNLGIVVEVIGEGDTVVRQYPNPNAKIKYNTVVYIELG